MPHCLGFGVPRAAARPQRAGRQLHEAAREGAEGAAQEGPGFGFLGLTGGFL